MKEEMSKLGSLVICTAIIANLVLASSMSNLSSKDFDGPLANSPKTIWVDDDFIDDPPNHRWDTIQEGVDDAIDGDTVFVFNGFYRESIIVDRPLNLIGEGSDFTVIDLKDKGSTILVTSDWVNISGFTVSNMALPTPNWGIRLDKVENCRVAQNNLTNNGAQGVLIDESSNNTVANNTFSWNIDGVTVQGYNNTVTNNTFYMHSLTSVKILGSDYNTVSYNRAYNDGGSIYLQYADWNIIYGNTVERNSLGVAFYASHGNIVRNNTFSENSKGIHVMVSTNNQIYHNNILDNEHQAIDDQALDNDWHHPVLLEGNYWSRYIGVDDGSGSGKHAIAGDGIGDTLIPYPGKDFDFYPCIFPNCENPKEVWPVADAGPDQTVNEGEPVYFNGTGSQASGYGWHKLDVNFATDSALYLRTKDPLGPYRGGWEGGVMEWVTFTSSNPFWIGKEAGHLGQGPTGKDYTYYWKMYEEGNRTLMFRAGNGGLDADVYDETDGVYIVSGLHVEQGSEEVVQYLFEGHVYRLDYYNTFVLSGFPNDLDVQFELNETEILLTPERESLVYYESLDPLNLGIEGLGVTEITFYSRGEQEFYAYYVNQLNHSEVEVTGGEIGLADPPYNTGITPSEYSDTPFGSVNLSYYWDFDASEDSDNDGNATNDIDATGATPEHVYADNGVFTVTLTVTDGSGLSGTDTCVVTVLNVPPTVELEVLPLEADISLRIAGEKWHDVSVELYENNVLIAQGSLTRYPGSPNDQTLQLGHIGVDMSMTYSAIIRYTPWDDPVNGQPLGANPVWIILNFSDGEELRLQHNFNVNHPDRWVWEVDLTAALLSRGIGFNATATDPGADDLTFHWDFGDGANVTNFYPNPANVFPVEVVDSVFHVFSSGMYTITLTVTDDDGGVGVATVDVTIP